MKKSALFSIIGVLLVIGVGVSFAYFVSNILSSGTGSNISGSTAELIRVTYDAGDAPLEGNNLMPGNSVSKDFTVTVEPTETEKKATYGIFLDITENTFVKCDDTNYNDLTNMCTRDAQELTYTITDDSNTVLASGDLTGVTGKVKLLTQTKTVDVDTTFNYTITITFVDTGADQNHNQNKTFSGDVVVEFSELFLIDAVKGAYQTNPDMLAYDEISEEVSNLRYIGADPNNYVLFNDELWRIIGIFSEDTHGVAGTELIKIIRDESIGNYSWDNKPSGTGSSTSSYGSNDWSDSLLQVVLNEGAYYNRTSGTCPSGSNGATKNCDFSSTGLTEEAKAMIETVTWKLGGTANYESSSKGIASHFYGYERGTTVYSGRPTEWTGEVGLMYPSDYGYATSGGATTDREACLAKELSNWDASGFSDCRSNDWLFESGDVQWTLTPPSSPDVVFYVGNTGYVSSLTARYMFGVRPSVYLTSEVGISDGEGTRDNPYILEV